MATVFTHELAAWISPEESTSVSFIGVSDQGRNITIANRKGDKAYVYKVGSAECITPVAFSDLLKSSLGTKWGEIKSKCELLAKIEAFESYKIDAKKWYTKSEAKPNNSVKEEWVISGALFAF
ncbi:hypothetical protein JCM30760_26960 [Thiomicrorhabdus hydrogeniphila]